MSLSGSFLLRRTGAIVDVDLHAPSTTYQSRGIKHLACTDTEFLYNTNKISNSEVFAVGLYCFYEYLTTENSGNWNSLLDFNKFSNWAELKYAPTCHKLLLKYLGMSPDTEKLKDLMEKYPYTDKLQNLYVWLCNNYVKVSVFGKSVEFRIASTDKYDWNRVIIDFILSDFERSNPGEYRYTVVKEVGANFKPYFLNADINTILENDDIVMADIEMSRQVTSSGVVYVPVE